MREDVPYLVLHNVSPSYFRPIHQINRERKSNQLFNDTTYKPQKAITLSRCRAALYNTNVTKSSK